jgi:hypothetical protein
MVVPGISRYGVWERFSAELDGDRLRLLLAPILRPRAFRSSLILLPRSAGHYFFLQFIR